MEFYRRGNRVKGPNPTYDFIVVVDDQGNGTWYYSKERDEKFIYWGKVDNPSRHVEGGDWDNLSVPEYVKVAIRLADPEDVYSIVMRSTQ